MFEAFEAMEPKGPKARTWHARFWQRLLLVMLLLRHHFCFSGLQAEATKASAREQVRLRASPANPDPKNKAGADDKPLSYYAGMLTNPPKPEDSEKDMITPTLKFVGYGTVLGLAYLAVFVGLNLDTVSN